MTCGSLSSYLLQERPSSSSSLSSTRWSSSGSNLVKVGVVGPRSCKNQQGKWLRIRLVLRLLPGFKCCTLKNGRAWEAKSRLRNHGSIYTVLYKVIAQSRTGYFAFQALQFFTVQHWKTGSGLGTRLLENHYSILVKSRLGQMSTM